MHKLKLLDAEEEIKKGKKDLKKGYQEDEKKAKIFNGSLCNMFSNTPMVCPVISVLQNSGKKIILNSS